MKRCRRDRTGPANERRAGFGQHSADAADRVSRQRQNDAAAPRPDRARRFPTPPSSSTRSARSRSTITSSISSRVRCWNCPAAACAAPCARIWRRRCASLIDRRDAGEIRRFGRIVVETSGLADPAPILFTLGTDPMLDQRLRLARVVTLVDAVTGADTLARFAEAARQAAVADALVISKTDLAPFGDALRARLDALNPGAERIVGAAASEPAAVLFAAAEKPPPQPSPASGGGGRSARAVLLASPSPAGGGGRVGVTRRTRQPGAEAAHTHGVATFTIDPRRPGQPARFRPRARRAGAGPRQRSAAGQGPRRASPTARTGRQSCRRRSTRCSRPEWLDAWPDARPRAAGSSSSSTTSRPTKSSRASPSPRRRS